MLRIVYGQGILVTHFVQMNSGKSSNGLAMAKIVWSWSRGKNYGDKPGVRRKLGASWYPYWQVADRRILGVLYDSRNWFEFSSLFAISKGSRTGQPRIPPRVILCCHWTVCAANHQREPNSKRTHIGADQAPQGLMNWSDIFSGSKKLVTFMEMRNAISRRN
jgi:hypothetical protein